MDDMVRRVDQRNGTNHSKAMGQAFPSVLWVYIKVHFVCLCGLETLASETLPSVCRTAPALPCSMAQTVQMVLLKNELIPFTSLLICLPRTPLVWQGLKKSFASHELCLHDCQCPHGAYLAKESKHLFKAPTVFDGFDPDSVKPSLQSSSQFSLGHSNSRSNSLTSSTSESFWENFDFLEFLQLLDDFDFEPLAAD